MNEEQIIKELEFKIDLTDAGMVKYLQKHYPDKDGRKYKKWIRIARANCKRSELEVEPPYDLNEAELKIWILVMGLLDRSILEPVDHIVLADYCMEKAQYYELTRQVKQLPNFGIVKSKNDQPYQHPLVGMANKKKELCERTEHKFGFDPSGRRKNKYEKKAQKQSALKTLMKGIGKKSG